MAGSAEGWQTTYSCVEPMTAPAVKAFQYSCAPATSGAFEVLGKAYSSRAISESVGLANSRYLLFDEPSAASAMKGPQVSLLGPHDGGPGGGGGSSTGGGGGGTSGGGGGASQPKKPPKSQ